MSNLVVIYDPERDLSTVVDLDVMLSWGPVLPGEGGAIILTDFIESTPWDMGDLSREQVAEAFVSFLDGRAAASPEVPPTPDTGTVGEAGDIYADAADVVAAAEGAPTDEPPAEQPADADMAADASTTSQVIVCPTCQGTGSVQAMPTDPIEQCGMCKGVGKLTVAVPV